MTHTSYPYIIRFVRSRSILRGGERTREIDRDRDRDRERERERERESIPV